jgi:radical SAM superfamily enzyme YgiQ (UPF0313 family)
MKRIGLIDVDSHNFPNLALMKISAYHKKKGDTVEWVNYFEKYDTVFMSKIFTFSPGIYTCIQADEIIKGGTGYDVKSKLPEYIETITKPDYSIYPQYKFSLQFFSRGCIRKCPFCLVSEKEGKIKPCTPLELNPQGRYIEVMDNNFFANSEWRNAVKWLMSAKQKVKLKGVDVRIINEEQAYWLNKLPLKGNIHIAWDNPKDDILPRIQEMLKHIQPRKISCYVLIGFNSTIEEDYERLIKLKELKIMPFVSPYRDFENKRIPKQYEKDLSRWANIRSHFMSCDFKDYSPRKGFKCIEYFKNNNYEKQIQRA